MKLLNTCSGLIGARFFGKPFYSRFHVTYRCNYRCRMCRLHTQAGNFPELALPEIRIVARRLFDCGARHVVLTGGEPFLREDLPEIVDIFSRLGFSVRVQTNGGPQVTHEILASCASAGLRDLSVSIDTLDSGLQDYICRGRGVVESALETLAFARKLLPQGMTLANITASRYNFSALPDLVKYFHRNGIYTYITPAMIQDETILSSHAYLFRSDDRGFCTDTVDISGQQEIVESLIRLKKRGAGLTNSTRFLRDFSRHLVTGQCRWQCGAGNLCVDVRPDGRVSMCKEKPSLTSILDNDFSTIHRSRSYREKAMAMAASCHGCFYGEYREPHYLVSKPSVLLEWVWNWIRIFRFGMKRKNDSCATLEREHLLPAHQFSSME